MLSGIPPFIKLYSFYKGTKAMNEKKKLFEMFLKTVMSSLILETYFSWTNTITCISEIVLGIPSGK